MVAMAAWPFSMRIFAKDLQMVELQAGEPIHFPVNKRRAEPPESALLQVRPVDHPGQRQFHFAVGGPRPDELEERAGGVAHSCASRAQSGRGGSRPERDQITLLAIGQLGEFGRFRHYLLFELALGPQTPTRISKRPWPLPLPGKSVLNGSAARRSMSPDPSAHGP